MALRRGLTAAAIAAALAAGTAGGATREPPTFQGRGTIVFACSGCPLDIYGPALYTVSASGRGFRKVRTTLSPYSPRWSPKGLFVALTHRLSRIATVAMPNGRPRLLTSRCADCAKDPAWSPDGRRIAFMRRGVLFTMRADGTRERRLVRRRERFGSPDWSPDGRRIAMHLRGTTLAIVNADGTGFRFINGINGRYPRWSPNGRLLAFLGRRGGGDHAVMVMRPDGTGVRTIVRSKDLAVDVTPAWSPDGRYILFTVGYRPAEREYSGHEFRVASLDGSPVRRIAIPELPKDAYSNIHGVDWTRRTLP